MLYVAPEPTKTKKGLVGQFFSLTSKYGRLKFILQCVLSRCIIAEMPKLASKNTADVKQLTKSIVDEDTAN